MIEFKVTYHLMKYLNIIVPQYHGGNKVISSVKIDFAKTLDTSGSAGAPVKAKAHGNIFKLKML